MNFDLQQFFGDLNRVERRAFAELVARDPDIYAAVFRNREILPDSADKDVVFAGRVDWHRETVMLAVIHKRNARRILQQIPDLIRRNRVGEFKVDALAVCPQNRHANAGRGNRDILAIENLPGLVDHFDFFLVVAGRVQRRSYG